MKKLVLVACAIAGFVGSSFADNGRFQLVQGRVYVKTSEGIVEGERSILFKIDTTTGKTWYYGWNAGAWISVDDAK